MGQEFVCVYVYPTVIHSIFVNESNYLFNSSQDFVIFAMYNERFKQYNWIFYVQGLTAVDITDDSSMIVGGFADSTVRVWSVTPKKLRSVKTAAGN